jgi:hypothetical protein
MAEAGEGGGVAELLSPGDVEALYAEPLGRFIEARTELVARLKATGNADAAKAASALRKPTVAAWAIDRLARDRPRDIEALLAAGEELRSAQRRAAAGGGVERLQEAGRERRRLVERLVDAASDLLEEAGMSSARSSLDKVSDTLTAIATDEEAAERVRRGILDKELSSPAGFGDEQLDSMLLASVTQLPRKGARDRERDEPTSAEERKRAAARERADRLASVAKEAEAEAGRLDRAARRAEAEAAAARRAADAGRRRAEQARSRANDARDRAR